MINLLPWREELRQKRKKDFLLAVVGAVLLGGLLSYGTKLYYQAQIRDQERLNGMLRTEITELDRQIAEINELDAQKSRLLARMEIIEQLQSARPEAVHLMDELVSIVPEGTYLTAVEQTGSLIAVRGMTQSQSRVSAILRYIEEESDWLRDYQLQLIETPPNRDAEFRVAMSQIRMNEEEAQ
jgi:type IV pilus assembly protein PilN